VRLEVLGEGPVSVAPLASNESDAADLDEVEEIATAAFETPQFSAREELQRPWTRCWIAREGPRAQAFLIAWHVTDELHVLSIATSPAARRRGLAMALMTTALDYAREQRVRLILLEVRHMNLPALRLYRKLGFTVVGIRAGYYSDTGEDAVEMLLALDPVTGAIQPGRDEIDMNT
jgi:[ribosomal protein S18]-alanine N-acetyltransferase